MSIQSKTSFHEQGNLMVMAVMVMLVLVILGTAITSLAAMEKKISYYSYRKLQAQEAADAGVEWALEQTLQNLRDDNPATGPAGTPVGSSAIPIKFNYQDDSICWEIVYTSPMPNGTSDYTYTFKSQGTYKRGTSQEISRTVLVSALFSYDAAAEKYTTGRITSYKIVPVN